MGNARRFLTQQSLQPQTEENQACWPTSLSEDVCPQPHPQVGCQDFSPGMASECPYGSPSGTEASLFVPCCWREQIIDKNVMLQWMALVDLMRIIHRNLFVNGVMSLNKI